MSRANRVPRSLDELLRALDDHAYLAGEAALRLAAGESAQLRSLAAELRTLVCWSSGTEGLLWRLVDQVGALDLVDIQLGGWVNESHPLAQGLSFVFVPMTRAGANDPRLPRRTASLKTVVKEAPAVYLHGRHYTHEDLIRSVAQQMGSAHEDDGLDPHLVALRDIVMGKADLLSNMMLIDADLVMEVAGRVFTSAGFTAAPRPHVTVSKVPQLAEAPGSAAAPTAEGTITLLLNQPDRGWLTNDRAYDFGTLTQGGLSVEATKDADGFVAVVVTGLRPIVCSSTRAKPAEGPHGSLMVVVTWTPDAVHYYLNGCEVSSP